MRSLYVADFTFSQFGMSHGLRTLNEGINRNRKVWADGADKIQFGRTQNFGSGRWELIFGCAVKAISSPGVRSPW